MKGKESDRNTTEKLDKKSPIEQVAGRFHQLRNIVVRDLTLPDDDHLSLAEAKVATLVDWVAERDNARISHDSAAMLDAHSRLASLGVPPHLASHLLRAGIDSSVSLAALSDTDRNKLEQQLRLPKDGLLSYQIQAGTVADHVIATAASSLLNHVGPVPAWFGLKRSAICGICSDETSIVGRLPYFRYLVKQTGKTIEELESVLYQDLKSLTPETPLPQITICNEVLARRYPGQLTNQEAAAGRRTLVLAYLTLLSGSLAEVASRLISEGHLVANQADVLARLRSLVEGSAVVVPTPEEMTAFQKVAIRELKSQIQSDAGFADLPNAEINVEATRRLEEFLESARRQVAELDRQSLRRRSGTPALSDHQLFRELYLETGLGSCEETTRLNQAISSLQAFLNDRGAAPDLAVNGHPYLTYEQWRGDQLGKFYPELQSLLRDDVLSGDENSWDRGSIIRNRTSSRAFVQSQLNAVKNAIEDGYLVRGTDRQKLIDGRETIDSLGLIAFKDSAYFTRFEEGLSVLSLILDADKKIADALTALDSDEPGLAIAHLNDADNRLREMGELAFSAGSSLLTTWQCDYRELAALPSNERQDRLRQTFSRLFSDIKRLYQARGEDFSIPGLDLSSGLVNEESAWTVSGVSGKVSFTDGGIQYDNVSTPPNGNNAEQQADDLNRATLHDSPLGDVQIVVNFEIKSTTYSRAPAVVDRYAARHYEMVGVTVRRQQSGAQYRVGIETALTENEKNRLSSGVSEEEQPPPPPFRWNLAIRKIPPSGGNGEVLSRLSNSKRFKIVKGEPYTLTINLVGQEIHVELATPDDLHRSVRFSDTSATALLSGTFGVRATATVNVHFGPILIESVTRYSIPPFYATSRESSNFYFLANQSIYDSHVDYGAGMASNLIDPSRPLVYDSRQLASETLAIRFDRRPAESWHLVFPSGSQAVSLVRLDGFLDRCLALSGYLRFAAIPVRMAQAYAASGDFGQAETLVKVVYDDEAKPSERAIYPRFSKPPLGLTNTMSIDERLMRLRLADILIQWAEWLFRQDNDDSRRLAYRLCTRILALYDDAEFCSCGGTVAELRAAIQQVSRVAVADSGGRAGGLVINILRDLDALRTRPVDSGNAAELRRNLLASASRESPSSGLRSFRGAMGRLRPAARTGDAERSTHTNAAFRWSNLLKEAEMNAIARNPPDNFVPLPNPYRWLIGERTFDLFTYCIPTNPIELEQKRRACLILSHLFHCRNVLGYRDDYIPPLRFDALLARAKSFADLALSAERDLLAFRDRFEAETFSLLQAQNALELANATVDLERRRVSLAESEIITARLQHEKAQASQTYYDQLVDGGLSDWEYRSLNTAQAAIQWSAVAAGMSFVSSAGGSFVSIGTGNVLGGVSGMGSTLAGVPASVADQLRQFSQYYSMQANFERREQEWRFQAQMSRFDVLIAESNVDQAFQRRDIAAQQQVVAEIQRSGAVDALHFLNNKFLNGAMYLWMMKTVREQYRTRLNYAISAAYMAERALAFELQEPIKVIRFDYFDPRRDGLLGATKLETDLATLADMKLGATKRKLQLSKTISLLQVAPVDLDRFKYGSDANDLGRLRFRTLMEWFDRDFPGHYLRLIKTVKVTVVALVPPVEGIHATLGSSGTSKTVINTGTAFIEKTIKRPPESIALSAPFQATGLFVLNYEDELLLPFEGSGVDNEWSFEMPQAANRFDYSTIADVLITIEYSALGHDDYRAEVIERLGRTFTADRTFSFRTEFVDQWYDLHNPLLIDDPARQMIVTFQTTREDFPPNLDQLSIEHVALYFAHDAGSPFAPVPVRYLTFEDDGNRDRINSDSDGIISTRRTSGPAAPPASWRTAMVGKNPVGTWDLSFNFGDAVLDDSIRQRFTQGEVRDILFVISYSGRTATWS